MKTIYILGRQPSIGLAELEAIYEAKDISEVSTQVALVAKPPINHPIGSAVKTAQLLTTLPTKPWPELSNKIIHYLLKTLPSEGKVTLGISVYGSDVNSKKLQAIGLNLKRQRKKANLPSLRLIPNKSPTLNSAQVLHNKLTSDNKWELLIIFTNKNEVVLAKTTDVQDIVAYTKRDRGRPRRDARVGMLPPKLAQTMINLANSSSSDISASDGKLALPESKTFDSAKERLLDPFCGTGVVLQEAALMGYSVYGTDLNERMIHYSRDNLNWLQDMLGIRFEWYLHQADATNATWQQPIDLVVSEAYLGRPFTSAPNEAILQTTINDCGSITKKFLENIAAQIKPGTKLCIAVPAWFIKNKTYRLPLLDDLRNIGYNRLDFKHASHEDLIYHREGQIVGRELLVLTRR